MQSRSIAACPRQDLSVLQVMEQLPGQGGAGSFVAGAAVTEQALGQLIQQLLLLLVSPGPGLFPITLDQLAQRLDPLVALAPVASGPLQALGIPVHRLPLLLDGHVHLAHEALVVDQPVTAHTLTAALGPALLVFAGIVLQVTQAVTGVLQLPLAFPEGTG